VIDDTQRVSVSSHRPGSVSVPRTLLVILFVVVCTRLAEVPRQYASSQPGGLWEEQTTTLPPTEVPAGPDLAESRGGDSALTDEELTLPEVRLEAERPEQIPIREPAALPTDALAPPAAKTRRPVPARAIEPRPVVDVASADPMREAPTPPPAPTPARVRTGTVATHAETVYYEIEGLSPADISAALRAHGPSVRGKRFFGLTEWEMGVEYRTVEVEAGCAIDDLKVKVSVATHLPQWPSDAVASAALSGAWEQFITALDQHEYGHRVLAEEAAETVRRRLLEVSAPTCEHLDGVARREMTAVMQEYEGRQLAYDAETEHGRTQGAVWPPPARHVRAHQGR